MLHYNLSEPLSELLSLIIYNDVDEVHLNKWRTETSWLIFIFNVRQLLICSKFYVNLLKCMHYIIVDCRTISVDSYQKSVPHQSINQSIICVKIKLIKYCRTKDHVTAADVVNNLNEYDLYTIIRKYGEEKHAKLIARAIVDSRYAFGPIISTARLADIVATVYQGYGYTMN